MTDAQATEFGVRVPLETAILIRRVFLPSNPNKMRSAAPEVVAAAKSFIAETDAAIRREAEASAKGIKSTRFHL